jgi:hypothetical protein
MGVDVSDTLPAAVGVVTTTGAGVGVGVATKVARGALCICALGVATKVARGAFCSCALALSAPDINIPNNRRCQFPLE